METRRVTRSRQPLQNHPKKSQTRFGQALYAGIWQAGNRESCFRSELLAGHELREGIVVEVADPRISSQVGTHGRRGRSSRGRIFLFATLATHELLWDSVPLKCFTVLVAVSFGPATGMKTDERRRPPGRNSGRADHCHATRDQ